MGVSIISKTQLRSQITYNYGTGKPIAFPFDMLRFSFGFERMDGVGLMAANLLFPNKSEEELQMQPDYKIKENIERWAKENNIEYYYDHQKDLCVFR